MSDRLSAVAKRAQQALAAGTDALGRWLERDERSDPAVQRARQTAAAGLEGAQAEASRTREEVRKAERAVTLAELELECCEAPSAAEIERHVAELYAEEAVDEELARLKRVRRPPP